MERPPRFLSTHSALKESLTLTKTCAGKQWRKQLSLLPQPKWIKPHITEPGWVCPVPPVLYPPSQLEKYSSNQASIPQRLSPHFTAHKGTSQKHHAMVCCALFHTHRSLRRVQVLCCKNWHHFKFLYSLLCCCLPFCRLLLVSLQCSAWGVNVNWAEIVHLCIQTFQATAELRLHSLLFQLSANFISLKLSFHRIIE